jgi:hypothetical protein
MLKPKTITIMATSAKLFVALSHTLTQSQVDGFESQYSQYELTEDGNIQEGSYYGTTIVTLKEVNPELQQKMSNIPATATLAEIQGLAKMIVAEAIWAGCTHFCLQGEPCLQIWANNYASGEFEFIDFGVISESKNCSKWTGGALVCIQSTTERVSVETTQPDGSIVKTATFSHVQWRELF